MFLDSVNSQKYLNILYSATASLSALVKDANGNALQSKQDSVLADDKLSCLDSCLGR